MADEANNSGQNADNNNQNNNNANTQNADTSQSDRGMDGIDANISKHLDIAIEAQDKRAASDAPAKTPSADGEGADKTQEGASKQPEDNKSGGGDAGTQKEPAKEVTEAARTLARAKDLTLADGSVVKGGAERRFYEQRESARQQLTLEQREHEATRQQLKELQTKYEGETNAIKSTHGVEPRLLAVGTRIVQDLQRDPVGTLKKLVAETAAQGYNVEDLGVGIDTAAIARMLEERLPNNTQKEPTDDEVIAESRKEVSSFYSQFPDAQPHDALIANVLRDHPDLSLRSVYFMLKDSFAEKGFDWSKSLEENLKENPQASDPQNKGDAGANNQNQNADNKPLPAGGSGNEGEFRLNNRDLAHEDLDTSDIVRAAMRESGYNV